jgi:hypothetical protein
MFKLLTEGDACSDCAGVPARFFIDRPKEAGREQAVLCADCAEEMRRNGQRVIPRRMLTPFQL